MPQIAVEIFAFGHILSAMAWLGGGILTMFILGPNVRKLSPNAALEFNSKVVPKVARFIGGAIGATFIFGLLLLYSLYSGDFSALSGTSTGMYIEAGVVCGLLAAVVGGAMTFPAFAKIARLSGEALEKAQPPSPDMAKYAGRARIGALVGTILLLAALAMMVAAGFG